MAGPAAVAFVDFEGDFSKVQAGAKAQGKQLESSFKGNFKNIAKSAALTFGAIGVAKLVKGAFSAAEESFKVQKQTAAVVKSTGGIARVSAEHVGKLADKLKGVSAVDDEIIASGENVLLTFTKVRNQVGKGNDVFDQGAKAALNLSTAFKTDLKGAMIQVGFALNDPIKGVGRLQKAGVSFTEAQKKQIKALVKTGDLLGAQKIVLKELTTEFGGAAAAAATPSERLKVAFDDMQESLGKLLVPLTNAFVPFLTFLASNPNVALPIVALGVAMGGLLIASKVAKAVSILTDAQAAGNLVFLANPIVLTVAAITALGVAIFIAYKKFGPFHDAVDRAWQILQSTFHWIQHNWPLLLAILTGPIGLAVRFIIQHWQGVLAFFSATKGVIVAAFKGVAEVIIAPYRAAFNAIKRLWNATIGGFRIHIPRIGIGKFKTPGIDFRIPEMHSGGIFTPGSREGLALLKRGEGVFTPDQMRAMGGTGSVDARTIVQGNVYGDSHLQRIFDEHDRNLALTLAAG